MEDADICDFATAIVEFDGESGYAIVSIDADAAAPASPRGPTDTTQLRAAVEALVNEADDSEVARLAAAATAESPDDLDERFWGPGPDSVTAVKAVFADLSDQFAQRQQLAANGISRDDAAELLGITAQSVTAKLASRKLVGIKVGREWRLPTWQFDPDVPTGVLPEPHQVRACFGGRRGTTASGMPAAAAPTTTRTAPSAEGASDGRVFYHPVAAGCRRQSAQWACFARTQMTLCRTRWRLGHKTVDAALRYQHSQDGRDAIVAAALSANALAELEPPRANQPNRAFRAHSA